MTRQEIIQRIFIKMDEASALEVGASIEQPQIDSILNEATIKTLLLVPVRLLFKDSKTITADGTAINNETGYFTLPDDFVRLVVLQMKVWEKPVHQHLTPAHELYAFQSDPFSRGSTTKPLCFINVGASGAILEYYSVKNNDHTVKTFRYMDNVEPEEISDTQLLNCVEWQCASMVFGVYGRGDASQYCMKMLAEIIQQNL
jgi:hypothetical protein